MPRTMNRPLSPTEAVDELRGLRDEYADKPEGERLTNRVIKQAVGVTQEPTISRWFSQENTPRGATLKNLLAFLAQARNRRWLEKFIKDNSART